MYLIYLEKFWVIEQKYIFKDIDIYFKILHYFNYHNSYLQLLNNFDLFLNDNIIMHNKFVFECKAKHELFNWITLLCLSIILLIKTWFKKNNCVW